MVTSWYLSCPGVDKLVLSLVNSLNWIWPNQRISCSPSIYIWHLTMYGCIIYSPLLCLTLPVWSPLMFKLFPDFRWEIICQPIRLKPNSSFNLLLTMELIKITSMSWWTTVEHCWCGHHMMAHLWRLSLSFILFLFGFILSIGLVFEIVRIIVLVFEID